MAERPVITVPTPPGGWGPPWPNVAELEEALPHDRWTVDSVDPRNSTAHRFRRGAQTVDLIVPDVVDVLVADHPPPRATRKLRGRDLVAIEGGTQALQRTLDASMSISGNRSTTVSVPSVLGALVLKAAAFQADSRDPGRHLADACVLLACMDDPYAARESSKGSDRRRINLLRRALPDDAPTWLLLDTVRAADARAALRILTADIR